MMLNSSQPILHSNWFDDIHFSIQKEQGAKRQVHIQLSLPYPIESVWQCLTNYDRLANIIPNLVSCRQLGQTGMNKQVEMIGYCQILKVRFPLRLVLDVVESAPYQIETQLVEGDLRSYRGLWHLEAVCDRITILSYSAELVPQLGMPVRLLERQAQTLLPLNFLAIRQYLDQVHQ
ncbi:MAG: SRPBCC family protein [Leptolyngbyaceae cyanobacterium bins.349]|nr:SRPBCC family protein [Leptolyngbyaceae cyanobacterium bins.349]